MKEYVITDELRDKIIKWFNNIAEEADVLTTGNVSHKKAKCFVLKIFKVIGIAFILISIANIYSLIVKRGYTNEIYKTGPLFLSDLHNEGFYIFATFIIVPIIIFCCINRNAKHKDEDDL